MINIVIAAGILVTLLTAIPVIVQMRHHPRGLIVCFFAEMWERFSYYGMRALLIYYLTRHFLFPDDKASAQYGSYTTLVYLLPLIGGLVADRLIGTRKAIVFGGILLVLGHFGMAFEGKPTQEFLHYQGQTYGFEVRTTNSGDAPRLQVGNASYEVGATPDGGYQIKGLPAGAPLPEILEKGSFTKSKATETPWAEHAFFLSIALIAMGVGFLKPNISSLVGQLYREKDPRRDSGFQLYYFGINMGSFWAAILCGYLGERVGWWAGFGLAGVGMLIGLLCFIFGKTLLEGKGEAPNPAALKQKVAGVISKENLVYLLGFAAVPLIYFVIQRNDIVGYALGVATVLILGYVFTQMATKFSRVENFRLGLAMVLTLSSVVFWTLFEQAGSSLSLFAERNTALDLIAEPIRLGTLLLATPGQVKAMGGVPEGALWIDMGFNASNTQSFNPFFILVFAPIFAGIFTFLAKRGKDPDPVKKFAFGLVMAGLGFFVLVWSMPLAGADFRVPLFCLFLTYMFHTWGELAVSPVGLSQQTKLSPTVLVSTMMAIWFLGTSGAQYLAAFVATYASTETVGGQVLDPNAALQASLKTFNTIGWAGIILGGILFALSFVLKGWAHGASDTVDEAPKAGN